MSSVLHIYIKLHTQISTLPGSQVYFSRAVIFTPENKSPNKNIICKIEQYEALA